MTSLLNKANRYFSKNVRGKAASAVHEMAVQVYGRMVDDSKDRSATFESLTTGERHRDDRGGYCNTKAFETCFTAYFCWFKKAKGHVKIEDISFSYNELAFVTLEVSALSSEACL